MLHAQGDHAADVVIVEGVVHGLALAAELDELASFQQPQLVAAEMFSVSGSKKY